jgi:hypothetical protein
MGINRWNTLEKNYQNALWEFVLTLVAAVGIYILGYLTLELDRFQEVKAKNQLERRPYTLPRLSKSISLHN